MTPVPGERPGTRPGPMTIEDFGDSADWPAAITHAVRLCLSSPLPMMVWWPERSEPIFNPACTGLGESNEPSLHTRIWRAIEADAQEVLRTGQPFTRDTASLLLPYPQLPPEACDACCLHPLLDQGRAVGVLMIGSRSQPWPWSTWRERMNYAAVIHSMDLGFCLVEVIDMDESELLDYVFLEVNPAYEIHSGLSHLVGRRVSEVVAQREPFWSTAIRQVLESGEVLQTTVRMKEDQRCFEACFMRMGGPGSRQVAILVKNITAQTQAASLLKFSEEQARRAAVQAQAESNRLSAVLDASPAAVLVVDAHNQISLVNAQARKAWGDLPDAGSAAWRGYWADGGARHGQRLQPSQWPLSRALLGHSSREIIEITSPRDGINQRTFLCSASPIWGVNLSIDGAVVVAMDITDRIEAEKALRKANAHKDEFLAMLGHELRNPLAPIAMAAQLMDRPDTCHESVRQTSAIIARQVRHMRGLIDDLLDTARVSQGLITLDLRNQQLQGLISEAVEQAQDLIQQRGHQLEMDIPTTPLILRVDGKRVVQIIANLLHNAAKYTPTSGLIQLKVHTQMDTVEIEVCDNGIGMSEDTLQHAFDLFSQADRRADREQGGLGLGLALVRKLTQLHGGRISASSPGPGQGSRFNLQLPLSLTTAQPEPEIDRGSDARDLAQLRIMVVDDNADAAHTLALFLQACGHECQIAHCAEQALRMSSDWPPQAFILDIGLPQMDGHALARQLRDQPATAQALLIALSGYTQAQEQKKAQAAGFDHYLVKPVDVNHLTQLLLKAPAPRLQETATA